MKLHKSSVNFIVCILFVIIVVGILYIIRRRFTESFQDTDGPNVHYYWIVSDKRKPMMQKQLEERNKIKESQVSFVPGIFDDNVENTGHPGLPKEWLGFPIARLLAAHMKAIRLFYQRVSTMPDKNNHLFVCLEDDVVLHKNYESMVQSAANYIRANYSDKPVRLSLGYVDIPSDKTLISNTNGLKISTLNGGSISQNGTQCYMLNYQYAKKVIEEYEAAYKSWMPDPQNPNQVASDHFIFLVPNTSHLIVEPPACLEDNPTFGSMLGHSWNETLYNKMIQHYNREDYYSFTT